jgi:hypothetical protein
MIFHFAREQWLYQKNVWACTRKVTDNRAINTAAGREVAKVVYTWRYKMPKQLGSD